MEVTTKQPSYYQQLTGTTPLPPKKTTKWPLTAPGIINERPHITIVCGKKNSGKSYLCCKLLKSYWRNVYQRIIFISPTFRHQYEKLWSCLKADGIKVFEEISEELINRIITEQTGGGPSTLLILDDLGEDVRRKDSVPPALMNKLCSNSRHLNLSIVSLNQSYTQTPTILRNNADTIICFSAISFREQDRLFKEVSVVDRKRFMEIFAYATELHPHAYLVATIGTDGCLRFFQSDFTTEIKK